MTTPQRFYDPSAFPWTKLFVERFDEVAAEAQEQSVAMSPLYPQYIEDLEGAKTKQMRWFARTLVFFTIKNQAVLDVMPTTKSLLEQVEGCTSAVIVKLEGNTHITPHRGYTPDVLRCHFGITVPEQAECVLRVEDERRNWSEREWLVFDDYLEHEVWHRGTRPRVVLLVDVVRPGVAFTPKQVAERFFNRVPGTRFDADLEQLAPPEMWLEWLEAGAFPI